MLFFNSYEIDGYVHQYGSSASNLGRAVRLLRAVRDHADENSDGWAYWPKPAHASRQLMQLIQGCAGGSLRYGTPGQPTDSELRAAVAPIKAFYTKHAKLRGYNTGKPYPAFPANTLE